MADVVSSPRRLTVREEEPLQHAPGRTRRRKTTEEVIEEMEPLETYGRVHDPTKPDDDDGHVLQQREKELKKDCVESSPYRYVANVNDQPDKMVSGNHDQEGKLLLEPNDECPPHAVQTVETDAMQMEVTMEITSDGHCDDTAGEGQPVALEAVSEQLRNLSPASSANGDGDSLIVIEHAAAIINLRNHGYPLPEPPVVNETARYETSAGDQQQPLLDTSRHSWHCDNETQINLTTDDLELSAIFTSNTPLQLRAVSSPSISEAPIEAAPAGRNKQDARNPHLSTVGANAHLSPTSNVHQHPSSSSSSPHQKTVQTKVSAHHPVQVSESVLQKFRKTFSHFKTSKAAPQPVTLATSELQNGGTMSVDDKQQQQQQQQTHHHHRFGPLIWRSSKERRKTKSHRRDKCNSGDSGIQVELDNDADQHLLLQQLHPLEHHPEGVPDGVRNGDVPQPPHYTAGVPVRRANSAKVSTKTNNSITSSSILKHKLSLKGKDKENVSNISRLSGKSLSQPSGLDCIVAPGGDCEVDGRRRRRRQHTRTSTTIPTELDLSDSESISSHPDEDEAVAVEDELLVEPAFAEVLFSFRPGGPQELGLEKGALVEVLKRESGPWWWGRLKSDAIVSTVADVDRKPSDCGWFPKDFVKIVPTYAKPKQILIISNNEAGKCHGACEDDDGGSSASTLIEGSNCDSTRLMGGLSVASDASSSSVAPGGPPDDGGTASHDLTKENIIKELLETEINYVKLLNSLCIGFIKPLREREDVFSVESVNLIFSNLEKIWRFQQTFLDALRVAVPNNRIGEVFLEYQSAFMVYSSYCNSYPRALMELENYANNKEANQILENCRMAENLPELPLSAHLLAPIQRICRYPLHLSELVKHSLTRKELLPTLNLRKCTKSELETMDCREVFEMALSAMRRVTEMVNEGKRHSEYLSRIQARFENFQGPSINVHSTRLFLQTDAIRMSPNLWNNTYTLFLFDRQLIYCKKDLLKRTNYIYKGRIFLDNCRILNLPDGKMFGVTLKNALRLYCDTRNKWFDFCFRSSSSKLRFLNTLSSERQFCGESLFVSELDGGAASCFDDDNLSDREYFPYVDDSKETDNGGDSNLYDMVDTGSGGFRPSVASTISSLSAGSQYAKESLSKPSPTTTMMPPVASISGPNGAGGGNTLPKKSRKMPKDAASLQQQQQQQVLAGTDYGSNSLGRRKLGNWFRKAKSTNSTPSQSPTHHPMAMSLASIGNNNNLHSDSSSQSSLVTSGFQQQRTLSTLGTGTTLSSSGTALSGSGGKGKPSKADQSAPSSTAALVVVESSQSQPPISITATTTTTTAASS